MEGLVVLIAFSVIFTGLLLVIAFAYFFIFADDIIDYLKKKWEASGKRKLQTNSRNRQNKGLSKKA
jgi:hypothetical protein